MEEKQMSLPPNEDDQKRAWEPPTIEELDFSATEFAYIGVGPLDLGIYSL